MDLKSNIEKKLWEAIERNYDNESYSSAILDAIYLLTETIRNRTGLEGDGSSLIGQAFGGPVPKIQLNKLQTESEKNIQKGVQELLRGLYTAIRNPRSHDKYSDTKEEANSIIYFINYLLKLINESKLNFEESDFLKRIFDEHYVETNEYSDLLVEEIPKRQRINIATSVILKRTEGNIYNLGYFFKALLVKLEENETVQVMKVISEELKYANSHEEITTILHIVPVQYWSLIDKAIRIRIENILYKDMESGKHDPISDECTSGAMATWVKGDHLKNFNLNWTYAIVEKLEEGDPEDQSYIQKFFWNKLCTLNYDHISYSLRDYIKNGLINKDGEIIEKLKNELLFENDHPWRKVFEEELKMFPELANLNNYSEINLNDDDLPF